MAEVSKDITAMANANGGVILYGVAEKGGVLSDIDGVDESLMNVDRFENIVLSGMSPSLPDLRIYRIQIESKVVYVLEVPRSPSGNQASDGRYYRRRNRRVDVLEDWEIRELMHRSSRAEAAVELVSKTLDRQGGSGHTCELIAAVANRGSVRIQQWRIELRIPTEYLEDPADDPVHVQKGDHGYVTERLVRRSAGAHPVFPGDSFEAMRIRFVVNDRLHDREDNVPLAVDWILHADDMAPRTGSVLMRQLHQF